MRKGKFRRKHINYAAACIGIAVVLSACNASKQSQLNPEMTAESESTTGSNTETTSSEADFSTKNNNSQDHQVNDPSDVQIQKSSSLSLQTETCILSEYDKSGTTLLAQENYDLIHVKADEYPALQKAIAIQNADMERAANIEYAENLAAARQTVLENANLSLGYTGTNEVKIGRVDDTVFSYVVTSTLYIGGEDPNCSHAGYTLNTQTGEPILLSEVIADKEAFIAKVIESLSQQEKELSGMVLSSDSTSNAKTVFFKNWKDDVTKRLQSELAKTKQAELLSEMAGIIWTLDASGLRLYFSPYDLAPYAVGTVTVNIGYEDTALFQPIYLPRSKEAVLALDFNDTVYFDVNGDGQAEYIYFLWQITDTTRMDWSLVVKVDGKFAAAISYGRPLRAWLMRDASGKAWLYAENISDNDYRTLEVFSLSGEKPDYIGSYHAGFWGNVPILPGNFIMGEHLDALSSYIGTRRYTLSENGMPTPLDPWFAIDGTIEVTALRDVPAKLLSEHIENDAEALKTDAQSGLDGTIPSSTKLRFIRTDGTSFVDMLSEDGMLWRVSYDASSWPVLIDGIDAEECFDGIRYAG